MKCTDRGTHQVAIKKIEAAAFVSYKEFTYYPSIALLTITTANQHGHNEYKIKKAFIILDTSFPNKEGFTTYSINDQKNAQKTFDSLKNQFNTIS